MILQRLKLSNSEKTVILARLAGFEVLPSFVVVHDDYGGWVSLPDGFYATSEMHNAQRIVMWALCNTDLPEQFAENVRLWAKENAYYILYDSQGFSRILDVILDFAIEAGMVEIA